MPLTAIKCCQTGKPEPFARCLAASLTGQPEPCKWPFPLIAYMAEHDKEQGEVEGVRISSLTGCARQTILKGIYDYASPPEAMWNAFRGGIGHEMMNAYRKYVPNGIAEVRLFKRYPVDGEQVLVSGKPDWQVEGYNGSAVGAGGSVGMVEDFKSTLRPITDNTEVKDEHYQQVHGYGHMFTGAEREDTGEWVKSDIRVGRVTYFNMETTKTIVFPVNVEGFDTWMIERIKPYLHYQRTGELPAVLPSKVAKWKGATQVRRHPLCNPAYCPVRDICDRLATEGR